MKWNAMLTFALAAVLLVGCGGTAEPPAPTPIPMTDSSSQPRASINTPVISNQCQPTRSLLNGLAASLPFEQAVIAHQAYGSEKALVLWLVSASINLSSEEQNQEAAELQAVQAARILLEANDCLLEFDTLNISLVDDQYQQWFSGSLRTIDLPDLQTQQSGGGTASEEGGGRQQPSQTTLPPKNTITCTWPEVSARLGEDFSTRQLEGIFYFVRDAGGDNVYAQWAVPDQQAALKVLDQVTQIANQVKCLYPPATGISILLTLPDGQTLLTGYLPVIEGQEIDPAAFGFNFIEQP